MKVTRNEESGQYQSPSDPRGGGTVFIAHASEDTALATMLRACLARNGWPTFVAVEDLTMGHGDPTFVTAIDKELDECSVLVVLVTTAALESYWVTYEWSSISDDIRTGRRKHVLPIRISGPPIKDWPRTLRGYQCIELSAESSVDSKCRKVLGRLASLQEVSNKPVRGFRGERISGPSWSVLQMSLVGGVVVPLMATLVFTVPALFRERYTSPPAPEKVIGDTEPRGPAPTTFDAGRDAQSDADMPAGGGGPSDVVEMLSDGCDSSSIPGPELSDIVVYFDYGGAELTSDARGQVLQAAEWMSKHPGVSILVCGHADPHWASTPEKSQQSSQARARAVADYLVLSGIAPDRIEAQGVGTAVPARPNHGESGWMLNRRVDFRVLPGSCFSP